MKRYFKYFLNGLLILAPVTLTVWIIIAVVKWLDDMFYLMYPGVGLLIVFVLVTLLGYISSYFFVKPFIKLADRIFNKVPLVSIIYSSIKDLFDAFVGDNQKFNKPVLVKMSNEIENYKLGFVTQEVLHNINLHDKVAVYFPHSYNFSGELFIVPKENVTYLDLPSSEVMKFVVSGGVSKL
jgi:uncharacterized membrane protein